MNVHQLQDALGELPEELITSTVEARGKRKLIWLPWVAAATCACLVLGLTWQLWPMFQAKNAAPESDGFHGYRDIMADSANSAADAIQDRGELVLLVQVEQVEAGGILVSVLPEQRLAEGTQIRIPVYTQQETYAVGDRLRIYCDGQLQETWPLQLGQLHGIERVNAP